MESAGLTIENKSTGCREQEYQVLGTGVPGIGNRSTRHWDNRIGSQPAKEHRCSSRLNSLLIAPGKTTEQEVQFFLQAEEQP